MPIVRKTMKQVRAFRLTPKQEARIDALTDEEITAAALADPDNPPITDAEWARARRGGRPRKSVEERKRTVTLRLPPDVIAHYRATGPGWQTRIGETLMRAAKRLALAHKRGDGRSR